MRVLSSLLLSLLLCLPLQAQDWADVARKVERSLVHVSTDDSVCAGFVINQKRSYVLTAAHCILNETTHEQAVPTVENMMAFVTFVDEDVDVAVLTMTAAPRPALHPRRKGVSKGVPAAAIGFAYGMELSTIMAGQVGQIGGAWVFFNFPFIGGMSGGPIVDLDGKVISVTQRSDSITGIGRPIDQILGATGKFWER
jgi:S1-C subfamily serine protease